MTFEQKFQEFLENNIELRIITEQSKVTLSGKQLRQVCKIFWDSATDVVKRAVKESEPPSLFDLIFGKNR